MIVIVTSLILYSMIFNHRMAIILLWKRVCVRALAVKFYAGG